MAIEKVDRNTLPIARGSSSLTSELMAALLETAETTTDAILIPMNGRSVFCVRQSVSNFAKQRGFQQHTRTVNGKFYAWLTKEGAKK